MYANTPNGANASDFIYSFVETAKANGVDVYYLKYMILKTSISQTSDYEPKICPWNLEYKEAFK